jgi:hypothetical protein
VRSEGVELLLLGFAGRGTWGAQGGFGNGAGYAAFEVGLGVGDVGDASGGALGSIAKWVRRDI